MTWRLHDPQCYEADKCRYDIIPYTRGRGLDIGCGPRKTFQHFIGVDSGRDSRLFQIPTCADVIAEADKLEFFADKSLDFVFSSHTLEHIPDHVAALKEWWRVLKVGGYLVLYLPHADFYPRKGTFGANPDHVHDFLPQDITDAMVDLAGWDLVVNEERDDGNEYSFLSIYQKRADRDMVESWKLPKPVKTCGVVRFGAWGDLIQCSSIFSGLKDQGYEVVLHTTPAGWEVVKHDPLIDRVVLQDHDQVHNLELGPYIDHLRKKYTKVIDLSESVEANFLAMAERIVFKWPHAARHALMNHNYGEMLHKIAGINYETPESRFVATPDEIRWAKEQKHLFKSEHIVLLVLAGSAVHKVYPHIDAVIERLFAEHDDVKIVTVGNQHCKDVLEVPWRDNPRMILRSGVWSIRETMAFAQQADVVIGPETGVLNAVAMCDMPKIVMLSHSSVENLTRDWVNTISLHSVTTPCYPCHKLIKAWDQCVQHESGGSHCMANITPDTVYRAIRMAMPQREMVA